MENNDCLRPHHSLPYRKIYQQRIWRYIPPPPSALPAASRQQPPSLTLSTHPGPVFLPRYRLTPKPLPSHPRRRTNLLPLPHLPHLRLPPHTPYHPSQILVGGDSAGGGLTLSFTEILLWLLTPNSDGGKKTIQWMGRDVEVALPKGLLIMSGWVCCLMFTQ